MRHVDELVCRACRARYWKPRPRPVCAASSTQDSASACCPAAGRVWWLCPASLLASLLPCPQPLRARGQCSTQPNQRCPRKTRDRNKRKGSNWSRPRYCAHSGAPCSTWWPTVWDRTVRHTRPPKTARTSSSPPSPSLRQMRRQERKATHAKRAVLVWPCIAWRFRQRMVPVVYGDLHQSARHCLVRPRRGTMLLIARYRALPITASSAFWTVGKTNVCGMMYEACPAR